MQANVGKHKIRIINAYGPQEDEAEKSLSFWQQLEAETISADDENCLTLIQLDANAKVGPEIIQNDPNFQSNNGVLLLEMIKRQNLFLLNASDLCQGKITRHRVTKNSIEMSIIDYVIVCEFLYRKLIKMTIDEERIHTLTKFASTRGVICKSESDHNPLFCQFSIPYTHGVGREERRTIFNLKNSVCQEMFHEVTEGTDIFSTMADENISVEERTRLFLDKLNDIFLKTFKKIRVNKKCLIENPIDNYIKN